LGILVEIAVAVAVVAAVAAAVAAAAVVVAVVVAVVAVAVAVAVHNTITVVQMEPTQAIAPVAPIQTAAMVLIIMGEPAMEQAESWVSLYPMGGSMVLL